MSRERSTRAPQDSSAGATQQPTRILNDRQSKSKPKQSIRTKTAAATLPTGKSQAIGRTKTFAPITVTSTASAQQSKKESSTTDKPQKPQQQLKSTVTIPAMAKTNGASKSAAQVTAQPRQVGERCE